MHPVSLPLAVFTQIDQRNICLPSRFEGLLDAQYPAMASTSS
jgi:hypothetical protein